MKTNQPNKIRILAVDDHEILRSGIKFSLLAHDDLDLVGEARDCEEALHLCGKLQPDVILMDMMLPGRNGAETTQIILNRYPHIKVLALTSFYEPDLVRRIMRAGAISYLVKGVSAEELAEAIRSAYVGQSTLAPEAVKALVHDSQATDKLGADLSGREMEVLELLAEGMTNAEIGLRLIISVATVKHHVGRIMSKLGAANRAEAVALAFKHDLIP